jgi:hypothetical protein
MGNKLDLAITAEELRLMILNGANNKAPGRDGICLEFFKEQWERVRNTCVDLFNVMYVEGDITDSQKQGVIVCVPKTTLPTKLEIIVH